MTIDNLFLVSLLVLLVYGIWSHVNMSRIARAAAKRHCVSVGVQFLDQNAILKKIAIRRSTHSLFALMREYSFEFSSVGDARYQGSISLLGCRVESIELPPYKTKQVE